MTFLKQNTRLRRFCTGSRNRLVPPLTRDELILAKRPTLFFFLWNNTACYLLLGCRNEFDLGETSYKLRARRRLGREKQKKQTNQGTSSEPDTRAPRPTASTWPQSAASWSCWGLKLTDWRLWKFCCCVPSRIQILQSERSNKEVSKSPL